MKNRPFAGVTLIVFPPYPAFFKVKTQIDGKLSEIGLCFNINCLFTYFNLKNHLVQFYPVITGHPIYYVFRLIYIYWYNINLAETRSSDESPNCCWSQAGRSVAVLCLSCKPIPVDLWITRHQAPFKSVTSYSINLIKA